MLVDLFDPAFADSVARIAAPILLASLGGAICHRAGVFNIALEGFILMGAFAAVLGSFMLGHVFWGVLCAIVAGIFMGLLFAEFHLRRPGDAIVVSIALNLIGLGLTTYLLRSVLGVSGVFQNELLAQMSEAKFKKQDLSIFRHAKVPCNDGGISLGQAVIAAARILST